MAAKGKTIKSDNRIADGSIAEQQAWKFIKEMNEGEKKLQATALIAGDRKYTYRQMFCAWDKYAAVFSALSINDKKHSRVGLACVSSAEAIFSIYGLNMTGAVVYGMDVMQATSFASMKSFIKANKITDLVASVFIVNPKLLTELVRDKEELGLKNIILLHFNAAGPVNNFLTAFYNESNLHMLRGVEGVLFMDDLLVKYEGFPISYGTYKKDAPAIVLQTSGTTQGSHKPIPHSNYSFNSGAVHFLMQPDLLPVRPNAISVYSFPGFDSCFGVENMLHVPFSYGAGVVVNYGVGALPNEMLKLISAYKVNVVMTHVVILDAWMMLPEAQFLKLDFLDYVALGGSYVSPEKRKRYNEFLKAHGSKARIINGFGMSEFCGACIFSPAGKEDDSIGYPLPGISVKIQDNEDGKFYSPKDGERTGEMYISSSSMALEKIDGTTWSERVEIEGEIYLRTNDVVSAKDDGCLYYVGRSNRYYVNNSNVRFDAGKIETAVSSQDGIQGCAMIPRYNKAIHDTIPMLCVKTSSEGPESLIILHHALKDVFVSGKLFEVTNLPSFCALLDEIMYNNNGKVDIYRMTKGEIKGKIFAVKPVYVAKKLVDIQLIPIPKDDEFGLLGLPEEIKKELRTSTISVVSEGDSTGKFKKILGLYQKFSSWFDHMPVLTDYFNC